eukprot:CAMPEP_0206456704 /NCGR_PEP_ID=MMETSP0324_2-20121206/22529_1 /ASSEMBLY_ACC=CAM_ASM_000836 /TAXON_ID=2866 /ORGANISM="Crypthecodinium cohnii, Strain Seligo" /LENGTH=365 /DNA_ID=CAMNT_0053927695 /DNA_START=111 /DNA_END=1208 /DNA_ORIENTATION=+
MKVLLAAMMIAMGSSSSEMTNSIANKALRATNSIAFAEDKDKDKDEDKKDKEEETTAPPKVQIEHEEEETTTPPPEVETTASVLLTLHKEISDQLRNPKWQWLDCLLALVFGTVLLLDGEASFKWIVVAALSLLVFVIAMVDVSTIWHLPVNSVVRKVVGAEAGLLTAYILFQGIEGVMLAAGAALGLFVGFGICEQFAHHNVLIFETNHAAAAGLYSACVVIFVAIFKLKGKGFRKGLGLVSAFFGSSLIIAALAWAFVTLYLKGKLPFLDSCFPAHINAKGAPLVSYLELLYSSHNKDVGLFVGQTVNLGFTVQPVDRFSGLILWFLIFLLGFVAQLKNITKKGEKVWAREHPLSKGLLAPEV